MLSKLTNANTSKPNQHTQQTQSPTLEQKIQELLKIEKDDNYKDQINNLFKNTPPLVPTIVDRMFKSESEKQWIQKKFNTLNPEERIPLFKRYLDKLATDQGFKPIKSVDELNLLSNAYDSVTQGNEKINTIVSAVSLTTMTSSVITTAVLAGLITTAAIAIPPVGFSIAAVAMFCVLGRCYTTFSGRYSKSAELIYIVSACLGFSTSIITLTGKMAPFYSLIQFILNNATPIADANPKPIENIKDAVKEDNKLPKPKYEHNLYTVTINKNELKFKGETLNNIHNEIQKSGAWAVVELCSYKFLFFLMKTIDFTTNNLGANQYLFWSSFLSQVSFEHPYFMPNSTDSSKYTFKYSKEYCAKMRDLVNLTDKGENTLTESTSRRFGLGKNDKPAKDVTKYKDNDSSTNFMCLNMNDFIMDELKTKLSFALGNTKATIDKTLQEHAHIILDKNIENICKLYPKLIYAVLTHEQIKTANITSEQITPDQIKTANITSEQIKTVKINALDAKFTQVLNDRYFGNIEKDIWGNPAIKLVPGSKANFIKQLVRITVELHNNGQLKPPSKGGYRKTSHNKYTKRHTPQKTHLSKTVKNQYVGGMVIPSPLRRLYQVMTGALDQQYREMLREYTILTANFTLINNEYMMHYNFATRNLVTDDNKDFHYIFKQFETEHNASLNQLTLSVSELKEQQNNSAVSSIIELESGNGETSSTRSSVNDL
jgi:hypothetical protein